MSWNTSDVIEAIMIRFNKKLLFDQGKVNLFLDHKTCHRESMMDSFSQIKIVFLPKNTAWRLQPLDTGIIENFMVKYRKRLGKYVLTRINENSHTTPTIKDVDILVAI